MSLQDQIRTIKITVAQHFDITVEDIDSRKRPDHIAFPRQIAQYFCVKRLRLSLPRAGAAFQRDHTSVLSAVRRVVERARIYRADRNAVRAVRARLKELSL